MYLFKIISTIEKLIINNILQIYIIKIDYLYSENLKNNSQYKIISLL